MGYVFNWDAVSAVSNSLLLIVSLSAQVLLHKQITDQKHQKNEYDLYNPLLFETFCRIKDKKDNNVVGEIYIYRLNNVRKWKGYIGGEDIQSTQSNFQFKIKAINNIKDKYDIIY